MNSRMLALRHASLNSSCVTSSVGLTVLRRMLNDREDGGHAGGWRPGTAVRAVHQALERVTIEYAAVVLVHEQGDGADHVGGLAHELCECLICLLVVGDGGVHAAHDGVHRVVHARGKRMGGAAPGVQAHHVRVIELGYGAILHSQAAAACSGGGHCGEDEVRGVLDVEL